MDNVANTGGVIWINQGNLTVNQTTFTNNTATLTLEEYCGHNKQQSIVML